MKDEINLLEILQEEFFKEIEKKTSWGKNELRVKYLEVKIKVLQDIIKQT